MFAKYGVFIYTCGTLPKSQISPTSEGILYESSAKFYANILRIDAIEPITKTNKKPRHTVGDTVKNVIFSYSYLIAASHNTHPVSGLCVNYHNNGGKASRGYYANNVRVGIWIEYHLNQTLAVKSSYEKGLLHGLCTKYQDNGSKISIGHYRHGRKNGKWTLYHENGAALSMGAYDNGVRTGKWCYWTDKCSIMACGFYDKGAKTGQWLEKHFANGKWQFINKQY